MSLRRRHIVVAAGAACVAAPALAARALAAMTDGPFYPPRAWRDGFDDWDADLTQVRRGGRVLKARGEPLALTLRVIDTDERVIDGAEVEIWQCDALQAYRHPNVALVAGRHDEGFQGFGAARSGSDGGLRFLTIRPVPYPGRTPHIHVKVRHAAFGEWTSQLFVDGDPGKAGDFLWRALSAEDRRGLAMRLRREPAGWAVQHALVLPA